MCHCVCVCVCVCVFVFVCVCTVQFVTQVACLLAGEPLAAEDVEVHTGLPPKVDGQLRCFCKVSINQVLWSAASPPCTIVRVKWWGEDGDGAVFRSEFVSSAFSGAYKSAGVDIHLSLNCLMNDGYTCINYKLHGCF